MATGYLLKVGDKTTCGGVILTGDPIYFIEKQHGATENSLTSCGKYAGQFNIIGGVNDIMTSTGKAAGTLDSVSSCPCKAKFIESSKNYKYEKEIYQTANIHYKGSVSESHGIPSDVNKMLTSLTNTEPLIVPLYKVCRYCKQEITNGVAFQPEFKMVIRKAIDDGNNINGVFQQICEFYVKHFDLWTTKYVDNMFSDLYDVVGKNYSSLSREDKNRFILLRERQKQTNFYGKYSNVSTDSAYDKVQHIVAGLWLGSTASYVTGVWVGWLVEKLDTLKAYYGDLTNTRQPHQIGFDWYDYAFTNAGSYLGHLLKYTDDNISLIALNNFAKGNVSFDSFYIPSKLDYMGMGKVDSIFPISDNGNANKVNNSLAQVLDIFKI